MKPADARINNYAWHSSGKTIGPALPTALRKQYKEEQEQLQKERKMQRWTFG